MPRPRAGDGGDDPKGPIPHPRKADKSENIANEGDLPPEQRRGDHDKDDKNGNDKK